MSPLRHAQVCWHHPVTVRKTRRDTPSTPSQHGVQARLRCQPAPRKPRHAPPQCGVHMSPAMACKPHHDPNPPRKNLATSTQRTSPAATPPTTAPRKSPTTNPPRPRPVPHRRHCSLPIVVLASCLYLFNCNYILLCINVANRDCDLM